MQQAFTQCTCCYRPLTTEETRKNEEKENFYYTICDECMKKSTERIFKIVGAEEKGER